MQVALAITFFALVAFSETLRHGVFGLSPSDMSRAIYGALGLGAVLILRGDLVSCLFRSGSALYGREQYSWSWSRTALGLFLSPLLWVIPVVYGFAWTQINVDSGLTMSVLEAALIQTLLVGLAEGLFFREAVIKAFGESRGQVYVISALSVFVFSLPAGVPFAMMATGAALYFLTLRLIGTNIAVVAIIHGATIVMFSRILSLALTDGEIWSYAAYFLAASAALSGLIHYLFATRRREPAYA
ncbi:hypothetical protein QO034_05645 [Sedimentitalea sp. JM2-8]|uniref:CAAX prenyl protease 2/Lysostaphin resistance protein A-like domain-containing protein n=1 Tax=Sedimentitalea xiamensis TaxID=3050037 RepID=A0ABT7FBU3_9RHOB|nr:CPBP family glutamic-type intramembrane protease [Sedimentitalea xiamensis]MDK3072586.1 hypothetical protein [Sedimentitalea xiamensis]